MPRGVNSSRVNRAARTATNAMATATAGITTSWLPFPSLWLMATSFVLPKVTTDFRGVMGNIIGRLFPAPTLADLAVDAVSKRSPGLAPVAAAIALLSLTQISMLLKMAKTIKAILTPAPLTAASEERFRYADQFVRRKVEVPVTLVLSLLSLVSLRFGKTTVRNKYTITPRYWGMAYLILAILKAYTAFEWARRKSPIGAVIGSRVVAATITMGRLSSSQQRQVFTSTPLVRAGPTKNHTHGKSASDRNCGSATAALAARSLGLEPYYIQKSLSDVRKLRSGDRSFHWAKDLAVPPSEFHFDPRHEAAVLVDVDYYIDMPNLLARYPGTYFVSTFQPTCTAQAVGEYTFRFLADNSVLYRVSGGAEYQHLIWDYKGDTILVETKDLLTKTVVSYHIDRKKIDEHHVLVMLSVIGSFTLPSVCPTNLVLEGKALTRLEPVFDNHVVLETITAEGLNRSVSILGDHISVTMPKTQMDAVHAVAMVAKVPITPAMVASNVAPSDPAGLPTERMAPGHAAVLASYLRAGVPHAPPVVYPPSECVVPISFGKHDYDAPVPMAAFGSPLIGPCYAYASSIASDDRCVAGRVEAFTKEPGLMQIPPKYAGYMTEFAERLIPEAHRLHPVGLDEIRDHQPRASQRAILEEAQVSGPFYRQMYRSFVKKETGVKPSDPRNISTLTPQAKLAYSSFLYAFHEHVMAKQPWYAFNKTPAGVAHRVTHILKNARHAVPSDANRYDGHIKWLSRVLERIIMLRAFAEEHHPELNERLDEQVGVRGVTTEGRKYASGYTRASGSPETSDINSVDTGFIGYCGWRETIVDGKFCTPDEAFARMGIYGGDDSLEGDIDPAALAKSAKMFGQKYKTHVVPRGAVGVEFLNRQFGPDVWNGDPNSMANPARALAKLWVGPTHLVNHLERFAERCSGYYRMDRNSPVLGEIVRVAHELLGERAEGILTPWAGHYSLDTNWPNEDSGWMIDVFDKFIPDFDRDRFLDWIWHVKFSEDASELLRAPLCTAAPESAPKPSISCAIADELVQVDAALEELVSRHDSDISGEKVLDVTAITAKLPREVAAAISLVPVLDENHLKPDRIRVKQSKSKAKSQPFSSHEDKIEAAIDYATGLYDGVPELERDGDKTSKSKLKKDESTASTSKADSKTVAKKAKTYFLRYHGKKKPATEVTFEVYISRPDLWVEPRKADEKRMAEWTNWRNTCARRFGVKLP